MDFQKDIVQRSCAKDVLKSYHALSLGSIILENLMTAFSLLWNITIFSEQDVLFIYLFVSFRLSVSYYHCLFLYLWPSFPSCFPSTFISLKIKTMSTGKNITDWHDCCVHFELLRVHLNHSYPGLNEDATSDFRGFVTEQINMHSLKFIIQQVVVVNCVFLQKTLTFPECICKL